MEQVVLTQVPIADLQGYIAHAVKEQFDAIRSAEQVTDPDQYLTRKEAARYLRLSLVTLHEYTGRGIVTAYRVGARVLYLKSDLDKCLSKVATVQRRAA
jgi:excisionase family DNA binding protein